MLKKMADAKKKLAQAAKALEAASQVVTSISQTHVNQEVRNLRLQIATRQLRQAELAYEDAWGALREACFLPRRWI